MEPYNESREVSEYEQDCGCVGRLARKESHDFAAKEAGADIRTLRDTFWKLVEEKKIDSSDESWKKHISAYTDAEYKHFQANKKKDKPDKKCDECKGTGVYMSTYNPDSKWDWFSFGGRWNGQITGKPINDKQGGFNFGEQFRQMECNHTTVDDLIKRKEIPFAIITPDGQWNERGKMGWFGCVSDEKSCEDWERMAMTVYEAHKDCVGVGLDCHI